MLTRLAGVPVIVKEFDEALKWSTEVLGTSRRCSKTFVETAFTGVMLAAYCSTDALRRRAQAGRPHPRYKDGRELGEVRPG